MMQPRWEPDFGTSAGLHLKLQEQCSHPWNQRLTSPNRRMYCGFCDVSFILMGAVPFDPTIALADWLDANVRRCGHGYIHISCGDCNRGGLR